MTAPRINRVCSALPCNGKVFDNGIILVIINVFVNKGKVEMETLNRETYTSLVSEIASEVNAKAFFSKLDTDWRASIKSNDDLFHLNVEPNNKNTKLVFTIQEQKDLLGTGFLTGRNSHIVKMSANRGFIDMSKSLRTRMLPIAKAYSEDLYNHNLKLGGRLNQHRVILELLSKLNPLDKVIDSCSGVEVASLEFLSSPLKYRESLHKYLEFKGKKDKDSVTIYSYGAGHGLSYKAYVHEMPLDLLASLKQLHLRLFDVMSIEMSTRIDNKIEISVSLGNNNMNDHRILIESFLNLIARKH